ncbi:MAG: peroxidase family protein [Blastocatellia bacterium]|nr:peroxidase family protein [Blastocatellia bacterium]
MTAVIVGNDSTEKRSENMQTPSETEKIVAGGALSGFPDSSRDGQRFGRMFPAALVAPPEADLVALGKLVADSPDLGFHPHLPAGYTYLGQFIAHDISFMKPDQGPAAAAAPEKIEQLRSPSLALFGLYGDGPIVDEKLYEADRASLKLGTTSGAQRRKNDLLRSGRPVDRRAIIPDERNDENLVLAQTHVAFTKFHNAVVDRLKNDGLSGELLFREARRTVVQHYHWIILSDYLPRVLDEAVLNDVIREHPLRSFKAAGGIPAEFAFAAFRFGHSLIRSQYDWNARQPRGARLHDLFELTGKNGTLHAAGTLPDDWIIDWSRFYDLSRHGFPQTVNQARKIQTSYTSSFQPLSRLLEHIQPESHRAFPILDLLRGRSLGLPSGQDIATSLGVRALTPDEIADGHHAEFLRSRAVAEQTPLLYYILKEAEIREDNRLGPVGSRIVSETMIGLLREGPNAILPRNGGMPPESPSLSPESTTHFGMPDLLLFVHHSGLARGDNELVPF